MKLTEEQKKLVEDNHNLIYGFIVAKGLNAAEWYGPMAESLCKAAATWRKDGGAMFSTYAYRKMTGCLCNTIRYNNRKERIPDEKLLYGCSQYYDTDNTLFDTLQDSKDVEAETLTNIVLKQYVCSLDERDRNIFFMMCNEERQETISEKVGLCQSYVSRKQKKMRKELKELLCL